MRSIALVGVGLAFLVVSLLLVLFSAEEPAVPTVESAVAGRAQRDLSEVSVGVIGRSATGVADVHYGHSRDIASDVLTVIVSVVDGQNEPVSGAEVEVVRRLGARYRGVDDLFNGMIELVGVAVTDEVGFAEVEVGSPIAYSINAHSEMGRASVDNVFPGAPVTLCLQGGSELSGRVIEQESGVGIGAVEVAGYLGFPNGDPAWKAVTDFSGRYMVRDVPWASYQVVVRDAARGIAQREVVVDDRLIQGVDFELGRGQWTSGRVIDSVTSSGIEGATVGPAFASHLLSVRAGSDGRYRLGGFPRNSRYDSLLFDAPGYGRVIRTVVASDDGGECSCDVVLEPGASMSGRVVDMRGNAIGGAYVAAIVKTLSFEMVPRPDGTQTGIASTPDWFGTTTDDGGRFVLEGLGSEFEYSTFVSCTGYGATTVDAPGSVSAGQVVDVGDIELFAGGEIRGVVVTGSGPFLFAGATAVLERGDKNERGSIRYDPQGGLPTVVLESVGMPQASLNHRGEFCLPNLAPGRYIVRIRAGASLLNEETAVSVESGVVTSCHVRLESVAVVRGVVRGAGGLSGVVRIRGENERVTANCRWDESGIFQDCVEAGEYRVDIVDQSGDPLSKMQVCEFRPGENELELAVVATATLSGTVVAIDDSPLAGAVVIARSVGSPGNQVARAVTGPSGSFSLDLVSGDPVDLLATWAESREVQLSNRGLSGSLRSVMPGSSGVVVRCSR